MHKFSRWKVPLSDAQTVSDVVKLMEDYLKTITGTTVEGLPASCWEALNVQDISGSAVVLIREELHYMGDAKVSEVLHEIAHTYVAASHRIASIQARG